MCYVGYVNNITRLVIGIIIDFVIQWNKSIMEYNVGWSQRSLTEFYNNKNKRLADGYSVSIYAILMNPRHILERCVHLQKKRPFYIWTFLGRCFFP